MTGLSLYYIWVLYLATQPQVSLGYQTYYIDKKTRFWGKDNGQLLLGESGVINVAKSSPYLSREGWNDKAEGDSRVLLHQGGLFFNMTTLPSSHHLHVSMTLDRAITEPVYASLNGGIRVELHPRSTNTLEGAVVLTSHDMKEPLQHLEFETPASLSVTQIKLLAQPITHALGSR